MKISSTLCVAASLLLSVQLLKSQEAPSGAAATQAAACPNFLSKSGVEIISATYGSGVNFSDVTEATIKQLNENPKFYATPEWLHADPTPGWNKALVIIFKYDGQKCLFSSGEGGKVDIPLLKLIAVQQEEAANP